MATRVLILSWEYPPIVEGGLARHVRKLSEQLVRDGLEVHVLSRGGGRLAAEEDRHGVIVHRVREPEFPRDDLDAFVRWVDAMNEDMRAAGAALGERLDFDLVHSHDWLVAAAAQKLARRFRCPWLVTVHATEHGRHQGWVKKHPQKRIHGVERRTWWLSRRWRRAARASSPTPAGCARWSRATSAWGCASARDSASLARTIERVLSDAELHARLVAEANQHVLGFDWADVGGRTAGVYAELLGAPQPTG